MTAIRRLLRNIRFYVVAVPVFVVVLAARLLLGDPREH
jgi:hypothetical protein